MAWSYVDSGDGSGYYVSDTGAISTDPSVMQTDQGYTVPAPQAAPLSSSPAIDTSAPITPESAAAAFTAVTGSAPPAGWVDQTMQAYGNDPTLTVQNIVNDTAAAAAANNTPYTPPAEINTPLANQSITPESVTQAYQSVMGQAPSQDWVNQTVAAYSDPNATVSNVIQDTATAASASGAPFTNTAGDPNSFAAGAQYYQSQGYIPGGTTYEGVPTSFIDPTTGQVAAQYGVTQQNLGGTPTSYASGQFQWNPTSSVPQGYTTALAIPQTDYNTGLLDAAKGITSVGAALFAPEIIGALTPAAVAPEAIAGGDALASLAPTTGAASQGIDLTGALTAAGKSAALNAAVTAATGGNPNQILNSALSGAVAGGVGTAGADLLGGGTLAKIASNAAAGAAASAITGGNAGQGALGGAINATLSSVIPTVTSQVPGVSSLPSSVQQALNTSISSAIKTAIAGGNVGTGALTGAISSAVMQAGGAALKAAGIDVNQIVNNATSAAKNLVTADSGQGVLPTQVADSSQGALPTQVASVGSGMGQNEPQLGSDSGASTSEGGDVPIDESTSPLSLTISGVNSSGLPTITASSNEDFLSQLNAERANVDVPPISQADLEQAVKQYNFSTGSTNEKATINDPAFQKYLNENFGTYGSSDTSLNNVVWIDPNTQTAQSISPDQQQQITTPLSTPPEQTQPKTAPSNISSSSSSGTPGGGATVGGSTAGGSDAGNQGVSGALPSAAPTQAVSNQASQVAQIEASSGQIEATDIPIVTQRISSNSTALGLSPQNAIGLGLLKSDGSLTKTGIEQISKTTGLSTAQVTSLLGTSSLTGTGAEGAGVGTGTTGQGTGGSKGAGVGAGSGTGTGTGVGSGTGAGGTGDGTGSGAGEGTAAGGSGTGTGAGTGAGTGTGGTGTGTGSGGAGAGTGYGLLGTAPASSVIGALPGSLQATFLKGANVKDYNPFENYDIYKQIEPVHAATGGQMTQQTPQSPLQLAQMQQGIYGIDPSLYNILQKRQAPNYFTYAAQPQDPTQFAGATLGSKPTPSIPLISQGTPQALQYLYKQSGAGGGGTVAPLQATTMAHGGEAHGDDHVPEFITGATGHYVKGRGDGQSDDIPAMLAEGEYVIDSSAVSTLGNGSSDAGAKLLDAFRESLREHTRSAPKGKIPPKASPLQYMKEAMHKVGMK